MATSVKQLRENLKMDYVNILTDFLTENGEDVLRVKSNEISFPVIDNQGNEHFIVLTVKIPTGANKGTEPYDGYEMAEEYKNSLIEKEEKKKKAQELKEKKSKRDAEFRKKKKELQEKREEK